MKALFKKIDKFMCGGTKILYTCMMAIVVAICIFCSGGDYYLKKNFQYANWMNVVLGIILVGLIFGLCLCLVRCLDKKRISTKTYHRIILGLNVLLGVYMFVSAYQYYFKTGWDAEVIINAASAIAHGQYNGDLDFYFSRCDNNVVIALLYAVVIKIGSILPFGNDYFYLVMFQCFVLAYSGYMLYLTVEAFTGKAYTAVAAWIVYVILMGMSPWVVLPYSDVLALFFLVTLLYLYKTEKMPVLFGVLTIIGFNVKPTVLILLIAMILLEFPKRWVQLLIGLLVGGVCVWGCIKLSPIDINGEKRLGVSHYLMLGLNDETDGVFSEDDLTFSESFQTNAERDAANWQEAMNRLKEMGFSGLIDQWKNKVLITFNDGSFAWGVEGGFFKELLYSGNEKLRDLYRQFFMPDGMYYMYFLSVCQIVWMGSLGWCLWALLRCADKKILVLGMTIIGVTLFEILFEPRARHLIIYLPVFFTLTAAGFENVKSIIMGQMERGVKK